MFCGGIAWHFLATQNKLRLIKSRFHIGYFHSIKTKHFGGINEVQKASKEHSSSPKAFVTLVQHSCYNLFSVMLTIFSGH